MIPYGRHSIDAQEIQALTEVLQGDWLTQGPRIGEFEQALAQTVECQHAVALANGTAALHIACLTLGVQAGDRVWTSPLSFVASANCALYCGADVDFVDIDPQTRNICLASLERKLRWAADRACLPRVLVVVHFAGACAGLSEIRRITQAYNVKVIEDAAHALGSSYQNKPIGACHYSDLTCFSFHPVKTLAMGEGGAICTNSPELAKRARDAITHGIIRDADRLAEDAPGPWYYEQQSLGYNYRVTDMQCALGLVQLQKLPRFIQRRRELVDRYQSAFSDTDLNLPFELEGSCSAWHIYVVELPNYIDRNQAFLYLRDQGIGCAVHYMPIHMQPYYQQLGFRKGDFPKSENYFNGALTLPLYPDLSESEQDHVITTVHKVLKVGLQ